MHCPETKSAGLITELLETQPKTVQPKLLGRLAGRAGVEVDDLAAQLFRRPLFFRRLKICRNVKFNQFRHHILLAGDSTPPSSVFQEPPQKFKSIQAHVSLFPYCVSCSSKLNAANKNTEAKAELLPQT
jgi:hypothetical protein